MSVHAYWSLEANSHHRHTGHDTDTTVLSRLAGGVNGPLYDESQHALRKLRPSTPFAQTQVRFRLTSLQQTETAQMPQMPFAGVASIMNPIVRSSYTYYASILLVLSAG